MKILVLFAHPAFHRSKVNKALIKDMDGIEGITLHDLYQEYPDFDIDIDKEQELLEEHDVIIFQFPLFWYSTPSLLKEWQDMVLVHGWAFGSEGNALKDKIFLCSITSGGARNSYQLEKYHKSTLNRLISPLRQTAIMCKMQPVPPFVVHGTHAITKEEIEEGRKHLYKLLNELLEDSFEIEKAEKYEYLNDYITKKEN